MNASHLHRSLKRWKEKNNSLPRIMYGAKLSFEMKSKIKTDKFKKKVIKKSNIISISSLFAPPPLDVVLDSGPLEI